MSGAWVLSVNTGLGIESVIWYSRSKEESVQFHVEPSGKAESVIHSLDWNAGKMSDCKTVPLSSLQWSMMGGRSSKTAMSVHVRVAVLVLESSAA